MQSGCLNHELWYLVKAASAFNGFRQCAMIVRQVQLPRNCPTITPLFSEKHLISCASADCFKATASEGLTLYPIVRKWCQHVLMPSDRCIKEAESFIKLCDVLDLLRNSRNGVVINVPDLRLATHAWLSKHKEAYGDGHWIPKMHYALHFPEMLARRRFLFACWVHERHHKVIKRFVGDHRNTTSLERALCEELIAQKNHEFEKDVLVFGLVRCRPATRIFLDDIRRRFSLDDVGDIRPSSQALVRKVRFHVGDVAAVRCNGGATIAQIHGFMHTKVRGTEAVIAMWALIARDSVFARFREADERSLVPLERLLEPVAVTRHGAVRHVWLPPRAMSEHKLL